MRCGGGLSHFTIASLLITVPVLSVIMDSTAPTPKHGICTPLVSTPLLLLEVRALSPNQVRPSRVVRQGTRGVFCKCSSALARTSRFCSPFPPYDSDMPLIGRVPTEGFLLGT